MSKRALPVTNEQRRRQAAVLTDLRKRAGLTPTQAAGQIGVSYNQLLRYESGENLLATNYYPAFATVYGVAYADLAGWILGLKMLETVPWSARAALEAAGLPADRIARILADISEWGELDQRAAVEGHIELHREKHPARESATA